jgi:hypothetical protein
MSDDLPANLPVRQTKEVTRQSKGTVAPANPPAALTKVIQVPPSSSGILLVRRQLAQFVRFASRLTTRSATPALRCCLFGLDSVVVTDLDVALRGSLPGARDVGVLVPVETLKRCLAGTDRPEISIMQEQPTPARPFAVRVDGALLRGHDPAEFPGFPAGAFDFFLGRPSFSSRSQSFTVFARLVLLAETAQYLLDREMMPFSSRRTAVSATSGPRIRRPPQSLLVTSFPGSFLEGDRQADSSRSDL